MVYSRRSTKRSWVGSSFQKRWKYHNCSGLCKLPDSESIYYNFQMNWKTFSFVCDGLKIVQTERTPFSASDCNPQQGFLTKHKWRKKKTYLSFPTWKISSKLLWNYVTTVFILCIYAGSACSWHTYGQSKLRVSFIILHITGKKQKNQTWPGRSWASNAWVRDVALLIFALLTS